MSCDFVVFNLVEAFGGGEGGGGGGGGDSVPSHCCYLGERLPP